MMKKKLRNIAIIAHVDHGKTTLIDALLKQTGTFRSNQQVEERIMDSNDLEKERGITILAKCTSITWNDIWFNIIDTPGHADFGGEVERVLSMCDGVILLTDATEGPMPQTKFVLSKALHQGLCPIVVINKVDKSDSRPDEVVDEVFDLFVTLNATDQQCDFPVLYASGRDGWCVHDLENDERKDLSPLLDVINHHVSPPHVQQHDVAFTMLVTMLGHAPFLGRILTGRVESGEATVNMPIKVINLQGDIIEQGRLTKMQLFQGIERVNVDKVQAGDIVCIAGLSKASVADTIGSLDCVSPIQATPIDPPTMSITIGVNTSPFAGLEGKKVTSTMIAERLYQEAETNVAITVTPSEENEAFDVGGRGELQLGVLIETMRREGFELSVSRPRVIIKHNDKGQKTEPIEEVVVDVDEEFSGTVVEKLTLRKGVMQDMRATSGGKTRLVFLVPSRGLIGYHGEFLTDTRGTGVLNRVYHSHEPFKGTITDRRNGALIALGQGEAVAYAIFNLQDRGMMFIKPQDKIYEGMIVGEHNRPNDLEINVLKGKQLTNIRASGSDEALKLVPPQILTLEKMIAYIKDDELVEVTPTSLRLRKRYLTVNERKKYSKTQK